MRSVAVLLGWILLTSVGCHPRPIVGGSPNPSANGTIAGIVSTDSNTPIAGRKVTAINTATGERYGAATSTNGGYTIKVPEGTYRLEVDLLPGEIVVKQPDETRVSRSDLDPQRHFVIARRPAG